MTSVAIMQPTYLPWAGYLGLMASVDLFVVLDSVQFTRRSWQQRNRIKTANGASFLTVPVVTKGLRDQLIAEARIEDRGFGAKHRRTIEHEYARAPHLDLATSLLDTIADPPDLLVELNLSLLGALANQLGITTPVVRSSSLSVSGTKADLLADICVSVGADLYISPPGSRDYLEESDALARGGIELRYFTFDHPTYAQLHGEFESHLSVVDMILNVGGSRARELIDAASGDAAP